MFGCEPHKDLTEAGEQGFQNNRSGIHGIFDNWIEHIFIIYLSYIYHIFIIYLSYIYHIFIIYLSYIYVSYIYVSYIYVSYIYVSYIYHIIYLSYIYHIFIIYLSYIYHIPIIYLSYTYHIPIIWRFPEMGVALNHPFQEYFPLQSIHFGYPHWNHNSLWGAAQKVDLVDHLGVSIGSLKKRGLLMW